MFCFFYRETHSSHQVYGSRAGVTQANLSVWLVFFLCWCCFVVCFWVEITIVSLLESSSCFSASFSVDLRLSFICGQIARPLAWQPVMAFKVHATPGSLVTRAPTTGQRRVTWILQKADPRVTDARLRRCFLGLGCGCCCRRKEERGDREREGGMKEMQGFASACFFS